MVPQERVETFLRHLFHDLRNDLNAVDIGCALLESHTKGAVAQDDVRQVRAMLREATARILGMRERMGGSEPQWGDYTITVLRESLEKDWTKHVQERAARKRLPEVIWEPVESVDEKVRMDGIGVKFALLELVENAVCFGVKEHPVRVRFRVSDAGVWQCVITQGWDGKGAESISRWGCECFESTARGRYGIGLYGARKYLERSGMKLKHEADATEMVLRALVTLGGGLRK